MNIDEIVKKLKSETNNLDDIIYREKNINKKRMYIIYNEPLTSSNKISDFIIRSLTNISINIKGNKEIINTIKNNISNFKYKEIETYKDICKYLHKGFTIIIVENEKTALALETKANINRSVNTPNVENSLRGPKDSFVEEYQINIGLIKKRIKTNDLWIKTIDIGKYSNTHIGVLYINGVAKEKLVDIVYKKLEKIDISGVTNSGTIKNLIQDENKTLFPTIITTERPDIVANALLEGKIAIVIDSSPYVLIIPGLFNDFFKAPEDFYNKSRNASFTRILKYLCFIIALLAPGLYIALITYNQEMIPTELLINFAIQRDGVPFPAFFECFIMITSFEFLKESDLRVPSFTGSSVSIVGALILGQAAVDAGIVSPIMIIVVAITAICSLPFSEPEITNSLRFYRLFFMIGASFLGIIGVIAVFIFFIIQVTSISSFDIPYLTPYVPTFVAGLKDTAIKFSLKKLSKRNPYLSNNNIKQKDDTNENN